MQPPWQIKGANRALDIACAQHMFAPWGNFLSAPSTRPGQKKWKLKEAADKTLIYENLDVLPRFYLVPEARFCLPEDVRAAIITGHLIDGKPFEPREVVLIDTDFNRRTLPVTSSTQSQPPFLGSIGGQGITGYHLEDDRLAFDVSMVGPGYLVLADLFYPGWQATVDGNPVEILCANYVNRAVRLEVGAHTVIFKYMPDSLAHGRNICWAALFGWLVILLTTLVWKQVKR